MTRRLSPCSPPCGARRRRLRREGRADGAAPRASEPLTVMLDYFPNADHAGIYAAAGDGDLRARPASTSRSRRRPTPPRR